MAVEGQNERLGGKVVTEIEEVRWVQLLQCTGERGVGKAAQNERLVGKVVTEIEEVSRILPISGAGTTQGFNARGQRAPCGEMGRCAGGPTALLPAGSPHTSVAPSACLPTDSNPCLLAHRLQLNNYWVAEEYHQVSFFSRGLHRLG